MLTSDHQRRYFAGIGTVYTDGNACPCMSLVLHFLPVTFSLAPILLTMQYDDSKVNAP